MDVIIAKRLCKIPEPVINNATFNTTVTGPDMDIGSFDKVGIYVTAGTKTLSPTLDITLQVKDPTTGHYTAHTTMTQITTAGDYMKEISQVAAETGRIVCTYGGTGNYANTYVTVALKS